MLRAAVGGLAGASLAPIGARVAFAAPGSGKLEGVRLSEHLVQVTGAGGNVVVLTGPESLALVDSGAPEHAEALLAHVDDAHGGKPIEALFNTHWHRPHTGANEAIGQGGARIYAHVNTRRWMSTEYYVGWQDVNYEPRPAAALPTETFYSSDPQPLTLDQAGHRVEYAHLPEAHTDGDIYVRFPDENVIVAGDVLGVDAFPLPDHATGGWIGGLQEATRTLIDLSDAETRIVPGTGPARTRADLEAQLEMLDTMRERIRQQILQGKGTQEILAADVAAGYTDKWGDPSQFVANVYDGIWWGGRLRGAY